MISPSAPDEAAVAAAAASPAAAIDTAASAPATNPPAGPDEPKPDGLTAAHTAAEMSPPVQNGHKTPQESHSSQPEPDSLLAQDVDVAIGQIIHQTPIAKPVEASIPLEPGHDVEEHEAAMARLAQADALTALAAYAQQAPGFEMGHDVPGLPLTSADGMPIMDMPIHGTMGLPAAYVDESPYVRPIDETRISAYAKLEFEDGEFYMNTYSVILGRDLAAARAAMRRDSEEQKRKLEEETISREPKTPVRIKHEGSRYSKSVISESGGILREGDDSDSDERARRRKSRKASKKSKSTGSSSQRVSRRNSLALPNGRVEYQAQSQVRRHAPDNAGAVPVDPASLRPSPNDCPLVGIHPPAATAASGYKAISRQHVKIAYNSKKRLFEAEVIGRNGAFVDDVFCYHNDVLPLKSGSQLQIGGVVVRFVLPDVAIGETGAEYDNDIDDSIPAERYAEGGKEMSFDFEETPRDSALLEDTSEAASDDDEEQEGADDDDENEEEGDEEEEDNSDELSSLDDEMQDENGDEDQEEAPEPVQQKRRGPGRPPKNGVMSKREQRELRLAMKEKEAQQRAKAAAQPSLPAGKNKVGRPRKHPLPDAPIKTEKRKYTKRKPKNPDGVTANKEGSGEDEKPKEKKEKKPVKPPRSPSPQFNEADLTPEQLAKPQANYVTLIHEALTNSATGQMSLPQIYRAIQRKYPFFVLKCNTNGWQSSVRHNLSQHHAFRKVERDGKGWMWAIVDGVSIEKEKKRRVTPPPQMPPGLMHHQPIYRAGPPPHMMTGPPGQGMMAPPPGYTLNPALPPHLRHPPQFGGPPMNGYMGHPPQPPPGIPAGVPPLPVSGAQGSTYSSPYASKPSPAPSQPPITQQFNPPSVSPSNTASERSAPSHMNSSTNGFLHQQANAPRSAHQQQQIPQHTPQHAPHQTLQQHQQHQQPQPQPQQPPPPPAALPEHIARAVETFKTALVASLKQKSNNAEAIVESAVNRVLGRTTQSTVSGDPHEEPIIIALRNMLNQMPGANFKPGQPSATTTAATATPPLPPARPPPISSAHAFPPLHRPSQPPPLPPNHYGHHHQQSQQQQQQQQQQQHQAEKPPTPRTGSPALLPQPLAASPSAVAAPAPAPATTAAIGAFASASAPSSGPASSSISTAATSNKPTTPSSTPAIQRPSFGGVPGQGRNSGSGGSGNGSGNGSGSNPPVPRPPMMTPGMARTNSGGGGSANVSRAAIAAAAAAAAAAGGGGTASASPAPQQQTVGNGNGNDNGTASSSGNSNGRGVAEERTASTPTPLTGEGKATMPAAAPAATPNVSAGTAAGTHGAAGVAGAAPASPPSVGAREDGDAAAGVAPAAAGKAPATDRELGGAGVVVNGKDEDAEGGSVSGGNGGGGGNSGGVKRPLEDADDTRDFKKFATGLTSVKT